MDIGFGAVVEKFEGRFGKTVTTILLGVMGLAVFGVCLNLIWQFLILPVVNLYNGLGSSSFKEWAQNELLPTVLAVAVLYPLIQFLLFISYKIYDRTIGERRRLKRAKALAEKMTAELLEDAKPKLEEIQRAARVDLDARMSSVRQEVADFFESKERALQQRAEEFAEELEAARAEARTVIKNIRAVIDPENPEATKEALTLLLELLEKQSVSDQEKSEIPQAKQSSSASAPE